MKEHLHEVLIVDDDPVYCRFMSQSLSHLGVQPQFAHTISEAQAKIDARCFRIVLLDLFLPDGNGLELLHAISRGRDDSEVIVVSGHRDIRMMERALNAGVWEVLHKPVSMDRIVQTVNEITAYLSEKPRQGPRPIKRDTIIGSDPQLSECLDLVAQASAFDASVLITGRTGTGKEVFARCIHDNSVRVHHPFVVVDCAVLPENLVESVLFGHVKGAFTGANTDRPGLVRQAHGGTLFLDEVGELPPAIQARFLRVLQEHTFRAVGSDREIHCDFRLIAATNRDLDAMVEQGAFRSDLLYRLKGFTIDLPSLQGRKWTIRELVLHYVPKICTRNRIQPKRIRPEFFELLFSYEWPGNIRELIQVLEMAIATAHQESSLYAKHLPTRLRVRHAAGVSPVEEASSEEPQPVNHLPSWKQYRKTGIRKLESDYAKLLRDNCGGDIQEACSMSGLKPARVYQLMKWVR
ncbi:MAG: sigma-54-dependent transcriptional regulator [Desulfovibrionales bacterium]